MPALQESEPVSWNNLDLAVDIVDGPSGNGDAQRSRRTDQPSRLVSASGSLLSTPDRSRSSPKRPRLTRITSVSGPSLQTSNKSELLKERSQRFPRLSQQLESQGSPVGKSTSLHSPVSANLLGDYIRMARERLSNVGNFAYGLTLFAIFVGLSCHSWDDSDRVELERSVLLAMNAGSFTDSSTQTPSGALSYLGTQVTSILETMNPLTAGMYLDGQRTIITSAKLEISYAGVSSLCKMGDVDDPGETYSNWNNLFSRLNTTCFDTEVTHQAHLEIDFMVSAPTHIHRCYGRNMIRRTRLKSLPPALLRYEFQLFRGRRPISSGHFGH